MANNKIDFWTKVASNIPNIIKKDGTAVAKHYFMATHVPFEKLEVFNGGQNDIDAVIKTEEQLYNELIVGVKDRHQMNIVTGKNGSGKSHLICWLYYKFIADNENYNPEQEKVVFLSRSENNIRSTIKQFLEQGIVQKVELKEKFEKFLGSHATLGYEAYKQKLYNAFTEQISNDKENKTYTAGFRKDIVYFLKDRRVTEHMLRAGGPIDKCYALINNPVDVNSNIAGVGIFSREDFVFPKEVQEDIKKDGSREAQNFYINTIKKGLGEKTTIANSRGKDINSLVAYLNRFTSAVVQSCADISSIEARDLFVDLRKSLKKEGKNLTILIEDFTSFTMVEEELIGALQLEHGGAYEDLCRVNSIIGMTTAYYNSSLQDNFKDRITYRINVEERTFTDEKFLWEMTARYLNAVYSEESELESWYNRGGTDNDLPAATIKIEYEWDKIKIANNEFTLYPFNKRSICNLHRRLKAGMQPRYFIVSVIRSGISNFIKNQVNNIPFPRVSSDFTTQTLDPRLDTQVEKLNIETKKKEFLKALLCAWGDGTLNSVGDKIAGIAKGFYDEIGLSNIEGSDNVIPEPSANKSVSIAVQSQQKVVTKKERDYNNFKKDINEWYNGAPKLSYFSEYRKFLINFIEYSIPWKDEGLPVYLVKTLFESSNRGLIYVEDSGISIDKDKAIIRLERNNETYVLLNGLINLNFYRTWKYPDGDFYQLRMINWIEANKESIKRRLLGSDYKQICHIVIKLSLAMRYLLMLSIGNPINKDNLRQELVKFNANSLKQATSRNINHQWNSLCVFIENNASKFDVFDELFDNSAAVLGVLGSGDDGMAEKNKASKIYRTNEIIEALNQLVVQDWQIIDEIHHYEHIPRLETAIKLYKEVYKKVETIIDFERKEAEKVVKNINKLIGNVDEINIKELLKVTKEFFITLRSSNYAYSNKLEERFTDKLFMENLLAENKNITSGLACENLVASLEIFSANSLDKLNSIVVDMQELYNLTEQINQNSGKVNVKGIDESVIYDIDDTLTKIEKLLEA